MADRIKLISEFFIKSSPAILFNYLSNASSLSEWFADDVKVRGERSLIFYWADEGEREAEIVKVIPKKCIKFRWLDVEDKNEYWEFEVKQDDLTNDVVLIITDYADWEEEEEVRDLWASQIEDLKASIGA
jgi:uncharacterized protein YndB with AHSA1/START domain